MEPNSDPVEASTSGIYVAQARLVDIEAIGKLSHCRGLAEWSNDSYADAIESKYYELLAAFDRGIVVGFILTRLLGNGLGDLSRMLEVVDADGRSESMETRKVTTCYEFEICNIAVAEEIEGRGLGKLLLDSACFKSIGGSRGVVYLEARVSNKRAIEFYTRNGFQIDGIRKNYYKNPLEDAILMTLKIEQNYEPQLHKP
ncbi:MAG: GNAT family N-acetyltransferase [Pyrinomonadaceae bacterium]